VNGIFLFAYLSRVKSAIIRVIFLTSIRMRHVKKLIYFWGSVLLAGAVSMNALAAEKKLASDKERLSYAIGVQIGKSLKGDGLTSAEIDPSVMGQAIGDVISDGKLQLSVQEMQAALQAFQQKKAAEREAQAKANKEAGDKFRAENKKKKGVKETKDGIQYEILKKGEGEKPKATDTVTVNYVGKLINGKVFDSSIERHHPATFPLNGVIKGWTEILPMMPEGSKWRVVIPPELAYGERGAGGVIGPNETLIFEIELLSIKK
jgi:FKBP-type peptidyl-prolyl cis-trans isomerase FklB